MTDTIITPATHEAFAPAVDAPYTPSLFQLNGRIGRVRYLGYGVAFNLIVLVLTLVLVFTVGGTPTGERVAQGLPALVGLVLALILGGRRLHDLGRSRWWALLLVIPVINVVVALWLICVPGQPGANRFGPRPGPNTRGVILLAWTIPLFAIAGILAALMQSPQKSRFERARDEMEQAI